MNILELLRRFSYDQLILVMAALRLRYKPCIDIFKPYKARRGIAFIRGYFNTILATPKSGFYAYALLGEPQSFSLLWSISKPEMTFLDIGAGIGSYAVPLAKKGLMVYAIEPDPISFRLLTLNAKINDVTTRIFPLRYCISRTKGRIPIERYVHISSVLGKTMYGANSIPLTELCETFNIEPDVIKIDVDGNEIEVLESGLGVIKNAKFIFIELRPDTIHKVDDLMKRLGKQAYFIEYLWSSGMGALLKPRVKPEDFMVLYV